MEEATGVKVFRHMVKKPGVGPRILEYLRDTPDSRVTHPSQIAVVGDRLVTDVMMANMMGSWAIWVKDGVTPGGFVRIQPLNHEVLALTSLQIATFEKRIPDFLSRYGYIAPRP